MRINKLFLPLFLFVLVVATSCLDTTDPLVQYADWKIKNETYFKNMKDSIGFKLFDIPANRGGGSYYYHIIEPGDANSGSPLYNDTVIVHYQGRLITWAMFDKTYSGANPDWYKNENPASFSLNGVVKGWTEALMQMKVGEKRRIVLPYALGYGDAGSSAINPYSTLIFDIKLISFGTPKNK